MTSDLVRRVQEHKSGIAPGFASRYGCASLVYFEIFEEMAAAIAREEQIKAGSRRRKLSLIETVNPDWMDLTPRIL